MTDDQNPKKPGKGARPTSLPRLVNAALAELYANCDGVLIIAVKAGSKSDTGETAVMRYAGSGLMLEGAVSRLCDGGDLFAEMFADVESVDEGEEEEEE